MFFEEFVSIVSLAYFIKFSLMISNFVIDSIAWHESIDWNPHNAKSPLHDHAKSNSLTIATLTLKSTTAFQFHHRQQLGDRKIIHLTTIFGKWLSDRQITHSKHLWKNDLVATKSLFWNCSSRWPSTCQINNLKPLWENNLATIRMSSRNNSKKKSSFWK